MDNTIQVDEKITDVPRVGITMALAKKMEKISWFGRGPHENYSDRKAGARFGKYESTVDDMFTPYILPQENGNRCDVTNLEIQGEKSALKFSSEKGFNFSIAKFSAHDYYNSRHTSELKKRDETILNIDYQQRGLGTNSCGPDTLDTYKLAAGTYQFDFSFEVIIIKDLDCPKECLINAVTTDSLVLIMGCRCQEECRKEK